MKLFLVYLITKNTAEPQHYNSYITESLQGIYDTIEKAAEKVDELHENSRKLEEQYPEYYYMEYSVNIEEMTLNK